MLRDLKSDVGVEGRARELQLEHGVETSYLDPRGFSKCVPNALALTVDDHLVCEEEPLLGLAE